jgi:copper homeostasis protein
VLLEVIVQSVEDARAAAAGGADRLEVVRRIDLGGLTPSLQRVRDIQNAVALPLRVMVRRNGGYSTTPDELSELCGDAAELASIGVDGLVVGFARDGKPEIDEVARVLDAAPGLNVTFHRAFDQLSAPLDALEALAALPQIDRILTNGGGGTPEERSARLTALTARASGRFVVIAGGGVDEAALRTFAATGCVSEAHVGRAARDDGDPNAPVSERRVRQLRHVADEARGPDGRLRAAARQA